MPKEHQHPSKSSIAFAPCWNPSAHGWVCVKSSQILSLLRSVGASLAIVSYVFLAQGHTEIGVCINLGCQLSLIPFNLHYRLWDMVGVSVFFTTINLHEISHLIMGFL